MGEKVTSAFEHAIDVLARKDDVSDTRRGLSETKINFLKQNKDLQARILQSGSVAESVLVALDSIKRPLYAKHPMGKFAWTITQDSDTIEWYNICRDALNNAQKLYQGKDNADIVQSKFYSC